MPVQPDLALFDPDQERLQGLVTDLAVAQASPPTGENPEALAAYQSRIQEIVASAPAGFQSQSEPGSPEYLSDLQGFVQQRQAETGYEGYDPDWRNKQEEMYRTSLAFQPPGDKIITTPTNPAKVKHPATGERKNEAMSRLLGIEARNWMGSDFEASGHFEVDPQTAALVNQSTGQTVGHFFADETGWRLDPNPPTRDGLRWIAHPESIINAHQGMPRYHADGTVNKDWEKPEEHARMRSLSPEDRYQIQRNALLNRSHDKINWPIAPEQFMAYQDKGNSKIIDAWNAGGKEKYIGTKLAEQNNRVRDLLAKAEGGRQSDIDAAKAAADSFAQSKREYDQAMATSNTAEQEQYQTNLDSAKQGLEAYRSEAADYKKRVMGEYQEEMGQYGSALEKYQARQQVTSDAQFMGGPDAGFGFPSTDPWADHGPAQPPSGPPADDRSYTGGSEHFNEETGEYEYPSDTVIDDYGDPGPSPGPGPGPDPGPVTGFQDPMKEMYPWLFADDFRIKEDPYRETPFQTRPIDTSLALARRESRADYPGGGYRRYPAPGPPEQDPRDKYPLPQPGGQPLYQTQGMTSPGQPGPGVRSYGPGVEMQSPMGGGIREPGGGIREPGYGDWIQDPYNIELTPLYLFKKKYGEKDIQRHLAATGQLRSTYGQNTMMRFYDKILGEAEQEVFERRKQREDLEYQRDYQAGDRDYQRWFQEQEQAYQRDYQEEARLFGRRSGMSQQEYQRALEREQIARTREEQLYGRRSSEEEQQYGRSLEREQTGYGRWLSGAERGYQQYMQQTDRDYQRRLEREKWTQSLKESQLNRMQMASGQGLQGAVAATAGADQASRTLTGLAGQAGQIQGLAALGKGELASGTSQLIGGLPGLTIDKISSQRQPQPTFGWARG